MNSIQQRKRNFRSVFSHTTTVEIGLSQKQILNRELMLFLLQS